MKCLLFVLMVISLGARAQQDFDFTLHTRHFQCPGIFNKDSLMAALLLERVITKVGSRLTITPFGNTGNDEEFRIHFQGFPSEENSPASLGYLTEDQKYAIWIYPTIPIVIIKEANSGKLYGKYY